MNTQNLNLIATQLKVTQLVNQYHKVYKATLEKNLNDKPIKNDGWDSMQEREEQVCYKLGNKFYPKLRMILEEVGISNDMATTIGHLLLDEPSKEHWTIIKSFFEPIEFISEDEINRSIEKHNGYTNIETYRLCLILDNIVMKHNAMHYFFEYLQQGEFTEKDYHKINWNEVNERYLEQHMDINYDNILNR